MIKKINANLIDISKKQLKNSEKKSNKELINDIKKDMKNITENSISKKIFSEEELKMIKDIHDNIE